MTDAEDRIRGAIAALWNEKLPTIRAYVEAVADVADAGDAATPAALTAAREAVHKLVGNLDLYGIDGGSDVARLTSAALHAHPGEVTQLRMLVTELGVRIDRGPTVPQEVSTMELPDDTDRPLVLVIDDDPVILAVLDALLAVEGFRVAIAESALDAWDRVNDQRPDAILLDLEMPYVHGVDFLRDLRADPWLGEIPILVHTGHETPALRKSCLDAGATRFINKGLNGSEVGAALRQALSTATRSGA